MSMELSGRRGGNRRTKKNPKQEKARFQERVGHSRDNIRRTLDKYINYYTKKKSEIKRQDKAFRSTPTKW